MKMTYDKNSDVLYIKFNNNKIRKSEEVEQNVVIDYDNDNNVVGMEILYFVKYNKQSFFPVFKEVEKAVWQENLILQTIYTKVNRVFGFFILF